MSGVSDCKVRVSQVLKADMSGVSKLNYWGTPSTLDVSASEILCQSNPIELLFFENIDVSF